jgi:hypothetical protein
MLQANQNMLHKCFNLSQLPSPDKGSFKRSSFGFCVFV